jgi:antitoxin (DNA-binding transcriptional repressor) of toxin-antitoxin stability system
MAKLKTTNTISLKDLRQNFPEFIEKIEKGKSFVVIKRSQPVFKISPVC